MITRRIVLGSWYGISYKIQALLLSPLHGTRHKLTFGGGSFWPPFFHGRYFCGNQCTSASIPRYEACGQFSCDELLPSPSQPHACGKISSFHSPAHQRKNHGETFDRLLHDNLHR